MERPKVKSFEGCEVPELAQKIYEQSLTKVHDEIGGDGFGWYGLVVYEGIPYIITVIKGNFFYKKHRNQDATRMAWGHICSKYERWYTEREQQTRISD
jgi:hypothetical protein